MITGTLEEPVQLKPSTKAVPPYIRTPGCAEASQKPAFELWNVTLVERTYISPGIKPDRLDQETVFEGYLWTKIANHVNGFLSEYMEIQGSALTTYAKRTSSSRWYSFTSNATNGFPSNEVETAFSFDRGRDSLTLTINQSWNCYEDALDHAWVSRLHHRLRD